MTPQSSTTGTFWWLIAAAFAVVVFAMLAYSGFGGLVIGLTRIAFVVLSLILVLALVVVWIRTFMGR